MNPQRTDPYLGFNFVIEVEKIHVGSFSEVSGLGFDIELEEYREGGVNDYVHKLPKVTKYSNIVLKRGMTNSMDFYNWYKDVTKGKIDRRQISIILLDNTQQKQLKRWDFKKSFPVKWIGPDLKADGNVLAVESIEIVHQGLIG